MTSPIYRHHRERAATTLLNSLIAQGPKLLFWLEHGGNAYPELERVAQAFADLDHELTAEITQIKQGYHQLDKNWQTMHETAMGCLRAALGTPEASVPDMVSKIQFLFEARHAIWDQAYQSGLHRFDVKNPFLAPVDPRPLRVFTNDGMFVIARLEKALR